MTEDEARHLARRAVDRLGGFAALEKLYTEAHVPNPEHEYIIEDERVVVRLRDEDRPATVYVGPFTFEVRDGDLVSLESA